MAGNGRAPGFPGKFDTSAIERAVGKLRKEIGEDAKPFLAQFAELAEPGDGSGHVDEKGRQGAWVLAGGPDESAYGMYCNNVLICQNVGDNLFWEWDGSVLAINTIEETCDERRVYRKEYHANGVKRAEGPARGFHRYFKGIGLWKYYDMDGKQLFTLNSHFNPVPLHGCYTVFDNDVCVREQWYYRGKRHGVFIYRDAATGEPKSLERYFHGHLMLYQTPRALFPLNGKQFKKEGDCIHTDADGIVRCLEKYVSGERTKRITVPRSEQIRLLSQYRFTSNLQFHPLNNWSGWDHAA